MFRTFQIVLQFPDYFAVFKKFLNFARISQIPVSRSQHIDLHFISYLPIRQWIRQCSVYNLFSGVELSMRSFFVISVSGMGFSAGGSVVPEVTWNLAFSNGFTYLNFDYCEQCSWHSGKTGNGDCGLASPFL